MIFSYRLSPNKGGRHRTTQDEFDDLDLESDEVSIDLDGLELD